MRVKIYGLGWVGRSMQRMFPDAIIDDIMFGELPKEKADIAFICVPTPNLSSGALDSSIVESVVARAQEDIIVLRSTVMPGTTDRLSKEYNKRIVFQPEYLGETVSHPLLDQGERRFMVLGGGGKDIERVIELYHGVYNANIFIRQTTAYEAEVIKLTENRAIAFKVAQCQELYDVCKRADINYYTIRDTVYGDDPRFNLWFTFVYPDNRGFNSKCIPKDVYGWAAWAESLGYSPELTNAMLSVNEKYII
jgi:UDPglucose 6-dehydrogenase